MSNAPAYTRRNKEWSRWMGRQGLVVAATHIRVAPPAQQKYAPYSYVIVDFGTERRSFMGAGQQKLHVGDQVQCVLRRLAHPDRSSLIRYGIKVKRV